MSSSIFERTRALHSDVEELRQAVLETLMTPTQSEKDRILVDHEVKQLIDQLRASQQNLLGLYEDVDGVRAAELASMAGPGDALWTSFYSTLSSIRMYHTKYPNAGRLLASDGITKDAAERQQEEEIDKAAIEDGVGGTVGKLHFSAEESFGSRVDMHDLFERYINLPQYSRTTDYITFLTTLHQFEQIPREKKIKAQREEYRKYLLAVRDYLVDFHQRIRPLVDINVMKQMISDDFEQRWQQKQIPGWFGSTATDATNGEQTTGTSAAAAAGVSTAATAAVATSDSTTSASDSAPASTVADASNPLYCVACAKLFAKQSVYDCHLPGKKHKKNQEILAALGTTANTTNASDTNTTNPTTSSDSTPPNNLSKLTTEFHNLAQLEDEILQFRLILDEEFTNTIQHLQKKQTRTYEEIAAEIAAQQEEIARAKLAAKEGIEEEDEPEDENAPIYNPLNLPLGFDGKPIPYWLYKLHGLNLKFDCEICGNFTYFGPLNFERHFTEWRHAYGMRALGIPNTKHFAHITKMDAALALFEKLKKSGVGAGWRAEDEEEYEDSEGNVFNKKTYLELQKQGLL